MKTLLYVRCTFSYLCLLFLNVVSKKGKDMFLYSAVCSPLDRSKRFTLYSLGDLSTVRYSFIQLSVLGCNGEN